MEGNGGPTVSHGGNQGEGGKIGKENGDLGDWAEVEGIQGKEGLSGKYRGYAKKGDGDREKGPEEGVGDAENGMRKERRVGGWRGRGRRNQGEGGNLGAVQRRGWGMKGGRIKSNGWGGTERKGRRDE